MIFSPPRSLRGLTLLETVVAMAILGVFFLLVFAATSRGKAKVREEQARVELQSLALALKQYAADARGWPDGRMEDAIRSLSGRYYPFASQRLRYFPPEPPGKK